jgi:hypothetical protein
MAKLAKWFTPKEENETIITPQKMQMKKFKFTLLSALMLSVAVAHGGIPPTQITSPQVITVPGHYILANDITATGAFGIEIQASDVNLDLNGHMINSPQGTGVGNTFFPGTATSPNNVRVTNGGIVAAGEGIRIYGSYCMVSGLTITIGEGGYGIDILQGQFNRVANCVIIGVSPTPGPLQHARAALTTFVASNNAIQDCTLEGIFTDTILEDDQAGSFATVVGNNNWTGIQFANPTQ